MLNNTWNSGEESNLEMLDMLVIISFILQMSGIQDNQKYIKNLHLRLDSLDGKIEKILNLLEVKNDIR